MNLYESIKNNLKESYFEPEDIEGVPFFEWVDAHKGQASGLVKLVLNDLKNKKSRSDFINNIKYCKEELNHDKESALLFEIQGNASILEIDDTDGPEIKEAVQELLKTPEMISILDMIYGEEI